MFTVRRGREGGRSGTNGKGGKPPVGEFSPPVGVSPRATTENSSGITIKTNEQTAASAVLQVATAKSRLQLAGSVTHLNAFIR